MSTPANPLDQFVTYTYHFELYAARSWDNLAKLEAKDTNQSTSPTKGTPSSAVTGTAKDPAPLLLINTRKDAHQIIDDVVFGYIGPSANPNAQFMPNGKMSMRILEPNGISLVQKIAQALYTFDVSSPSSLVWGIKIFFVGRLPDNTIVTMPPIPPATTSTPAQSGLIDKSTPPSTNILIPMMFKTMTSAFSNRGGEYELHFVSMVSINTDEDNPANLLTGYCNKSISFKAKTVKEALSTLQDQLNANYAKVYVNELANTAGAKKLNYIIKVDPAVEGDLDAFVGDNFAPGSIRTLSFPTDQTIVSWIFTILRGSKKLNSIVGDSLQGLKKEDHNGVKILSVMPTIVHHSTSVDLIYNITFYEGGSDTTTFDFLYASAGKNVDVLSFDIKMNNLLAWFSNGASSYDKNTNQSSTLPKIDKTWFQNNTLTSDVTKTGLSIPPTGQLFQIPAKSGDVAHLYLTDELDYTGLSQYTVDAVPSAKYMFNTLLELHGATNFNLTFKIRGNLNLLTAGIIFPGSANGATANGQTIKMPFGVLQPKWIKVNIKDQAGNPFFYTGKYNLVSIENHFSQGVFTQNLYVFMMSADVNGTTITGANTNTPVNGSQGFRNPNQT